MSDVVTLDRPQDGVAVLTLNRPDKRNALSIEVREVGCGLLAQLADDESVRVLVVTGADAIEAHRLGLVTRLVAPDEVLDSALALASSIAAAPRQHLARLKAKVIRRARVEPGATLDL